MRQRPPFFVLFFSLTSCWICEIRILWVIVTTGFFYGYVVQGVCQRLQQLSWIKLLFRRFDADLVFFWAPLPVSPQRKERWKQTCLRVLTLFLPYHWYWHFGKLLLGSDGFEIQNAEMYPFSPHPPPPPRERKRPGVFTWEAHSDRRLSVQTMGERETEDEMELFPSFLSPELGLKFVVFSRKVAVKLDSSRWTLSYLKRDGIKESRLTIVCQRVT